MKAITLTLTAEQMKHLEELGLDTSDASMFYHEIDEYTLPRLVVSEEIFKHGHPLIPAYTLQDILEKHLFNLKWDKPANLIQFCMDSSSMWIEDIDSDFLFEAEFNENNSILDAAYKMLVWCIENNFIKTKEE